MLFFIFYSIAWPFYGRIEEEHCVETGFGGWNDKACVRKNKYVCEFIN
jgi:hypothetical protein